MRYPSTYAELPQTRLYTELLSSSFGLRLPLEPQESFRTFRNQQVHIDLHAPARTARGTVILVHGAGGHGRLLAPFAAPFVAQGFAVCAPDLPGYGLTRGPRTVDHASWIELVTELANELGSTGPVFLFGLSLGGITALRAAQRARCVAGVIATTLIDPHCAATFDRCARSAWLGRLARWLFRVAPTGVDALSVPLRWVTPLEKMTTDAALARLLNADALLGARRIPFGFWRSLHSAESASCFDLPCPLLLVHPGADVWTPLDLSRPVFDAVQSPKQLVVLSNGAHAPLEQPAYAELCAALVGFVERHGPMRDAPNPAAAT